MLSHKQQRSFFSACGENDGETWRVCETRFAKSVFVENLDCKSGERFPSEGWISALFK